MPILITGKFAPSGGPGSFNIYDPADMDPGDVDVLLQLIAGGKVACGSHATAPVGELIVQRRTTTGATTHSATEGTLCWNSVDDILYCNNNGTTGWTAVGSMGPAGPQGEIGPTGTAGAAGATGPQGDIIGSYDYGGVRTAHALRQAYQADFDFSSVLDQSPTTLASTEFTDVEYANVESRNDMEIVNTAVNAADTPYLLFRITASAAPASLSKIRVRYY